MFKNIFSGFKTPNGLAALAIFALTTVAVFAFPGLALADNPSMGSYGGGSGTSQTLGDVFCNVYMNAKPFGLVCQWTAYVAAVAFVIQGINQFRLQSDGGRENHLNKAIMLWLGAMCLMALPTVTDTIILSVYGTPGSSGTMTCSSGGSNGGGTTPDVMLTNLMNNIKAPLLTLISLIAILCGLFAMVRGLMKASKYGFDPRTHSVNSILANIVFGALLFTIGDNMNMIMSTVFGTSSISSSSVISWSFISSLAGGASTQFQNGVMACLTFVQLLGAIAFVRGWLIMKKVVEGGGQATMAQGITHILGGVFAINIYAVLKIFDNTLGTGML